MKRAAVIYWLIPAKAERELFASIISILARELGAPLFEPHLTLFPGARKSDGVTQVLKDTNAKPLKLRILGVHFSSLFTKTLFVRFARSAALDRLTATMQRRIGLRVQPIKDPHLSLCYKKLPVATKRRLAAMIDLPLRMVAFDMVKAVRGAVPTRDAVAVSAWQVVGRKKLRT